MKKICFQKLVAIICIISLFLTPTLSASALSFYAYTDEGGYDGNTEPFSGGTMGCSVACHGTNSVHTAWVNGSSYLDTIAQVIAVASDDSDSNIDQKVLVNQYLVVNSFYCSDSNLIFNKKWAKTIVNYNVGG